MATHSSILAWRVPGMEEPGGLLSLGRTYRKFYWTPLGIEITIVLETSFWEFTNYCKLLIETVSLYLSDFLFPPPLIISHLRAGLHHVE